jgi:hypothetical protein
MRGDGSHCCHHKASQVVPCVDMAKRELVAHLWTVSPSQSLASATETTGVSKEAGLTRLAGAIYGRLERRQYNHVEVEAEAT